jgi:16S rRNA (uracil1498-N3)-methyltransferase
VSLAPHVLVAASLEGMAPGATVTVDPATLHHLRRVLRLRDDAPLSLTDGSGRLASGELVPEGARVTSSVREVAASPPMLVLVQALSKGRRAEDAVRVACELGVDLIVPVIAERTQGRPDQRAAAALAERWRAVAGAALEQSRGSHLTEVVSPVDGLAAVPEVMPGSRTLRLLAVPGASPLPDVLDGGATAPDVVIIAVGPEGGWSPAEVEGAAASGWSPVGLGATVLRTEHAGPVAVAVAAAMLGRWRTSPVG